MSEFSRVVQIVAGTLLIFGWGTWGYLRQDSYIDRKFGNSFKDAWRPHSKKFRNAMIIGGVILVVRYILLLNFGPTPLPYGILSQQQLLLSELGVF